MDTTTEYAAPGAVSHRKDHADVGTVNRGDTGQDGVIPVAHFRRRRVVKLPENK